VVLCLGLVTSRDFDRVDSIIAKDQRHHEHGHNDEFDHDAFLGKDVADEYDQLSVEESKAKLSALLPKVDVDGDGDITVEELEKWIKIQILDYVHRDAKKAMPNDDENKDGVVSWEEYVINTFGEQYLDLEKLSEEDSDAYYIKYVRRDQVRFDLADQNDDNELDFEEFSAFLHPEEFPHMADIVVEETLEDMDEDEDGKISLSEYIGDFLDVDEDDEDEDDKEWVEQEKASFQEKKDQNGDGYLDRKELADWIIPMETQYSLEEAKHLVERADENKDGVLSFQEAVENYQVFVGSQATDYGRILHHEL